MHCPYCVSDINDEAVVCPVCRRDLYLFKPLLARIEALEKQVAAQDGQGFAPDVDLAAADDFTGQHAAVAEQRATTFDER